MSIFDKRLMEEAARGWAKFYGPGVDRDDRAFVAQLREHLFARYGNSEPDQDEKTIDQALFALKWADSAFRTFDIDSSFAAALMCTPGVASNADDIRIPWEGFLVRVPRGLFVVDSETRGQDEFDRLLVLDARGNEPQATIHFVDSLTRVTAVCRGRSLSDMLFADDHQVVDMGGLGESGFGQTERVFELGMRLVAGILFTTQHTNNFHETKRPTKRSLVGRSGPPEHRVTVIGKPIQTNFSDAVRSYVSGRKQGLAKFQSLTCGHYKRQVVGVGGTGRKVIWIEPYWRGPKDAPILARPYRVGPKDEST